MVSLKDVHNHKVFRSASFTRGRFPTDSGSIIHVSHGTVYGNQFLIMPIVTLPAGRRREERKGPEHSGGSWHRRYRQSHGASAISGEAQGSAPENKTDFASLSLIRSSLLAICFLPPFCWKWVVAWLPVLYFYASSHFCLQQRNKRVLEKSLFGC